MIHARGEAIVYSIVGAGGRFDSLGPGGGLSCAKRLPQTVSIKAITVKCQDFKVFEFNIMNLLK